MGASYTAVEGIGAELGSPPVVRAAIYCRRSRRGGRSVERQEQDGRQIAAEKGWEVVAVYREWASVSPYAKKSRKEWDALLAAVEADQLDAVIVWMEDRTARDVVQAGAFVQACRKVGLKRLVLPSFDYDLTDEEAVIRFYGEVLGGQREAALISKRSKRAHLEEAQNGKRHSGGKRAFGERGRRRVEDVDGSSRTVPAVSEEQAEAERELIREAARRILAGDSLRGICLDWNEAGYASPRGASARLQAVAAGCGASSFSPAVPSACHKQRGPAVSSGQSRSLRGGRWAGRMALTWGGGGGQTAWQEVKLQKARTHAQLSWLHTSVEDRIDHVR